MRSTTADARERGGVTAEFAAALPAVVVLLVGCLAGVQLVGEQVRVQDAAAIAARSVARGETSGSAASRAARLVSGARLSVADDGDLRCATVSVRAGGAGALLRITLSGRSCAMGGGL